MKRNSVFVLAVTLAAAGMLGLACGDDTAGTEPNADGGRSDKDDGRVGNDSGSGTSELDGGTEPTDAGDGCTDKFEPPDLNGPGPCGAQDFGKPAAPFGPLDEDAGTTYSGTTLADGIYDAVSAERLSGNKGSWRESFVVKGNRFTRIRQIDTGTGNGLGPISYRSGTFAYDVTGGGQTIKLVYDCAWVNDAGVDAGDDSLPSDAIVAEDCSARFRFGAAGIRITLRRR